MSFMINLVLGNVSDMFLKSLISHKRHAYYSKIQML